MPWSQLNTSTCPRRRSGRRGRAVLVAALLVVGCEQQQQALPPTDLMQQARMLLATERPQESIAPLQALLLAEPANIEARRLLARAYLALEDGPAADSHLQRALLAGADPAELESLRIRALVLQKAYGEALALVSAEDVEAMDVGMLLVLAEAHVGLNELAAARRLLERILASGSHGQEAHTGLFEIAVATGQLDVAEVHLAQLPPGEAATWRLEGRLALQRGQHQRATLAYQSLLAGAPDDEGARLGLAQSRLAAGDHDMTRSLLQAILDHNPDSIDAHYLLAVTEYLAGDLEKALEHDRDVLSRAPQHAPALRLFGLLNLRLGRPEQAIQTLENYLATAPDDHDTRKLVVAVLLRQQHPWEAETVLKAARDSDDDPDVIALRGVTQLQLGNFTAGIELLRRAAEVLPTEPAAANGTAPPVVAAEGVVEVDRDLPAVDAGAELAAGPNDELLRRVVRDPEDTLGLQQLAARAEERADTVEACALYARLLRREQTPAASERFEALECEARYGSVEVQSEYVPGGREAGETVAGAPGAVSLGGEVAALLRQLQAGDGAGQETGDGHAAVVSVQALYGSDPPVASASSPEAVLGAAVATRVASQQMILASNIQSGEGRQFATPLHLLPPELKAQLKEMRDRLPEWLRALNDAAPAGTGPQTEPALLPVASTPRAMDAGPGEPPRAFRWFLDVYGGTVDGLSQLSRSLRDDGNSALWWLILPLLAMVVGYSMLRPRHAHGRGEPTRRNARATPPEPAKAKASETKSRRTEGSRRRGHRRRYGEYRPR